MFITFTQGRPAAPKPLAVNTALVSMVAPNYDGGSVLTIQGNDYVTVVLEPFEQAVAMLAEAR